MFFYCLDSSLCFIMSFVFIHEHTTLYITFCQSCKLHSVYVFLFTCKHRFLYLQFIIQCFNLGNNELISPSGGHTRGTNRGQDVLPSESRLHFCCEHSVLIIPVDPQGEVARAAHAMIHLRSCWAKVSSRGCFANSS